MGRLIIPGVCQKKGKTYRRFRYYDASGKRKDTYIPLPGPTDPRFAGELERVNREAAGAKMREELIPGSFGALARDFRAALINGWTKKTKKAKGKNGNRPLAKSTMENYQRYIAMFESGSLLFENR